LLLRSIEAKPTPLCFVSKKHPIYSSVYRV